MGVRLTSFAIWNSAGVFLNQIPSLPSKGLLATWPTAPKLADIHPKARRPDRASTRLVQLTSHLLGEGRAHDGDMVLGSASGCLQADLQFQEDVRAKGSALGSPSLFVYTLSTAPLGECAIAFRSSGRVSTVSAGTASGSTAVSQAITEIQKGRSKSYLAGETEVGVKNEQIILCLFEHHSSNQWETERGFLNCPSDNSPGSLLEVLQMSIRGMPGRIVSTDAHGFWAAIHFLGHP